MTKLKFFVASFICLCVYATLTIFYVTSTLFEKLVTVLVTVKITFHSKNCQSTNFVVRG